MADESGAVAYGQLPARQVPSGLLSPAPPESRGPAVETSAGGFAYGVEGPRAAPVPQPERGAGPVTIQPCVRCAGLPEDLLTGLQDALRRAGAVAAWPCRRCGTLPPGVIAPLAAALASARTEAQR